MERRSGFAVCVKRRMSEPERSAESGFVTVATQCRIAAKQMREQEELLEEKVAKLEAKLKAAAANAGQQAERIEKDAKSECSVPMETTQEMNWKMVNAKNVAT